MNTEEKFITIPFHIWEEKYKPMEKENERMKDELKRKVVRIELRAGTTQFAGQGRRTVIGYVETEISPFGFHLDSNAASALDAALRDEYSSVYSYDTPIVSAKEARLAAQEYCDAIKAFELKTATLPKLVKWLFKIGS